MIVAQYNPLFLIYILRTLGSTYCIHCIVPPTEHFLHAVHLPKREGSSLFTRLLERWTMFFYCLGAKHFRKWKVMIIFTRHRMRENALVSQKCVQKGKPACKFSC